jgi:hypothetical protein
MLYKRIEVSVAVQQLMSIHNAPGRDQRVDSLANSDTERAQATKISGGFDSNMDVGSRHDGHPANQVKDELEVALVARALQYLGYRKVRYGDCALSEDAPQPKRFRRAIRIEQVDPDARIDDDH